MSTPIAASRSALSPTPSPMPMAAPTISRPPASRLGACISKRTVSSFVMIPMSAPASSTTGADFTRRSSMRPNAVWLSMSGVIVTTSRAM